MACDFTDRQRKKLLRLKDEAFNFIVDALVKGQAVTEWQVQQFLVERMKERRLDFKLPADSGGDGQQR